MSPGLTPHVPSAGDRGLRGHHLGPWLVIALSALLVVTTAAGAWWHFSPVPFWDMWNGFLLNHQQHGLGGLALQHNEHRLVLARLLYALDVHVFGDLMVFLIVCNLLLIALTAWVLLGLLRARVGPGPWFAAVLVAWLFLWGQRENITWAFQSGFFFVTLLPLVVFDQARRSVEGGARHRVAAIGAAALACVAMINGLLALPLLLGYALLMRWSWRWLLALALITLACWVAYFQGYHTPGQHGSPLTALREHPLGLLVFIAMYVGSPWHFVAGEGARAPWAAATLGALLLGLLAAQALLLWRDWRRLPSPERALRLALLGMAAFVLVSAAATAVGRVAFGLNAALASRYVTPALLLWAVTAVLWAPALARLDQRCNGRLWVAGLLLMLVLLPQQRGAFTQATVAFERMRAALALTLGVSDQDAAAHVFASIEVPRQAAQPMIRAGRGVFGRPPLAGAAALIGRPLALPAGAGAGRCAAYIDRAVSVTGDPAYGRVEGWFIDPTHPGAPQRLALVDAQGVVRGVGVTGQWRPDVSNLHGWRHRYAGFALYVPLPWPQGELTLVDTYLGCVATPDRAAAGAMR